VTTKKLRFAASVRADRELFARSARPRL